MFCCKYLCFFLLCVSLVRTQRWHWCCWWHPIRCCLKQQLNDSNVLRIWKNFLWPCSFLLFVSSVKFISPCFCHGMLSLWKLLWFHISESYGFRLRGNRLPSKQNLLCWKQMSETWTEDAESNLWWEFSQSWEGRNSGYGLQVWHSPEDDGYSRPCHSHLLSSSLFTGRKGSETDISDIWYFPS